MIGRYIAHQGALGRSPATIRDYRKRLRYFAAFRGTRRLRGLTLERVRGYHESLIARGLMAASRKAYMSTVRGYLRWAAGRGLMSRNLADRIELPVVEKKLPPTPLTVQDMAALLDGGRVRTPQRRRDRAVMEVLYACGLRRAELLGLDVGDVDFAESRVFVRGKGAKDRVLPVHGRALGAVRAYLRARGGKQEGQVPLFVAHRGPNAGRARLKSLAPLFRAVSRRLGKHVHPHLMRHTFAVHVLQGGADVRYVQALLGHESPDTTSRYLGLAKNDLKRAYDAAVARLMAGQNS